MSGNGLWKARCKNCVARSSVVLSTWFGLVHCVEMFFFMFLCPPWCRWNSCRPVYMVCYKEVQFVGEG
ncbi:unnamed protein product [Lathyrus oleraceus]